MEGKFVPPGPGNDPVRNPSVLPTGRNLYGVNPEEIPTRPSWELAKKLVNQMLDEKLKKEGRYPKKIGFDLNGMETMRHFGAKPGEYGTRILHLIPRSGVWDDVSEVTDVYLFTMSYVYTQGLWGEKVDGLYKAAIQGTETIMRTWSSNMSSPLTNHHFYEYLGGLNLAVKSVTGEEPEALVADVRDANGAKIRKFEDVLAREYRVRLFNQKWIKGMMQNDYAGAGQVAELVKNTFGWKVTRPSSVTDYTWNEIYAIYVEDKYQLKIREWFEKFNPHAFQEMAATLMEAARKKYWDATAEQLAALAEAYAKSVVEHGSSEGLISGGNEKLRNFLKDILTAPGSQMGPPLLAQFQAQIAKSEAAPETEKVRGIQLEKKETERVRGKEMEKVEAQPRALSSTWQALGVAIAVLLLVVLGYRLRRFPKGKSRL